MTLGAEQAVEDAGLAPARTSCSSVAAAAARRCRRSRRAAGSAPRSTSRGPRGELGTQIALDWVSGAATEPDGVNAQQESGFPLVLTADTIGDFECQWEG